MELLDRLLIALGLAGPEDPDLLELPEANLLEAGDVHLVTGVRTDGRAVRWFAYYQNRRDRPTSVDVLFLPGSGGTVTLQATVAPREVGFMWSGTQAPRDAEAVTFRTYARSKRAGGRLVRRRRGAPLVWRGEPDPWDEGRVDLAGPGDRPEMYAPAPTSRGSLTIWTPELAAPEVRKRFLDAAALSHLHVDPLPPLIRQDTDAWAPWRRWALALPALLIGDGWPIQLHTHCPAGARSGIQDWWGVSDLESARAMLAGLAAGRHAPRFEELRGVARRLGPAAAEHEDPQVRFAGQAHGVPDQGIRAWDIGRIVSLTRSTYTAGYMTEDEAWDWIEEAARQAHASFGSWREWGQSWVLGDQFWRAGGQEPDPDIGMRLERLLKNPLSAWGRAPWSDGRLAG